MIIYHRAAISFRKTACFPYKSQNGKSAFIPLYCLMVASGFSFFKSRWLWVYFVPQHNRTTRIKRKQENNLTAQARKSAKLQAFRLVSSRKCEIRCVFGYRKCEIRCVFRSRKCEIRCVFRPRKCERLLKNDARPSVFHGRGHLKAESVCRFLTQTIAIGISGNAESEFWVMACPNTGNYCEGKSKIR